MFPEKEKWRILFVLGLAMVIMSSLCTLTVVAVLRSTPGVVVPPEFNGVYTILIGTFEDKKSAVQSIHGINVTQHNAYIIKTSKNYCLILGEFEERREAKDVLQSFLAKEQFASAKVLTSTRRWKLIN